VAIYILELPSVFIPFDNVLAR